MAAACFLNVDLDIESRFDVSILKKEMGRKVFELYSGPVGSGCFLLALETSKQFKTPDDTIDAFCSALERMSPKGKRVWRSAYKKEFNIGHDTALGELSSEYALKAETLQRVAKLGASIGVTVYDARAGSCGKTKEFEQKETKVTKKKRGIG